MACDIFQQGYSKEDGIKLPYQSAKRVRIFMLNLTMHPQNIPYVHILVAKEN